MLDDLRNSSVFIDDEEEEQQEAAKEEVVRERPSRKRQTEGTFLGMTAAQRFILSLMLFMMICLVGAFALVLSGSIALP